MWGKELRLTYKENSGRTGAGKIGNLSFLSRISTVLEGNSSPYDGYLIRVKEWGITRNGTYVKPLCA
ncbi:hypothetical protein HBI56_099670 [Parastagonospora nodorum]|nr:hypothetical protein HBH56_028600 [Parastagonospora nodorum]KAH3934598.1 hypothetical protein HBH54_053440 [Parastagonospora nodorum]KAH3949918.1 hypothetical protein HBH53_081110 [Parastagonospora nodorum]KAH3976007.1 hypothetical protein HBH51_084240 [Parastagonospora nodorum]KAH4006145.1 hypothetical protein HBI10_024410 [Parastagonospora nodorum]